LVDLLIEKDKQVDYWLVEEMPLESIELSVGVTRDIKGKLFTYSVTEDVYDNGSWIQSQIPARITKTLQNKAIALAKSAIGKLGGTGAFTVNISVDQDKELYVRDIHPYATENAVYTNENSTISQYDHLIRTLLGMPLYPAKINGVMLLYLENNDFHNGHELLEKVLEKVGTNVYAFNGKTQKDMTLLYTFKADTWKELNKNITI
ncbi:MAG TPA: ATP-grasp domain-containing protein, partial [Epulopiscium sp.]|nr:ATP-grasp domain-containing protein [Candidatus Epulonipiscium sp.]